ncbi:trypsin-like serine protease [Nemania sp. FL0916]|nr:trypsin-like serine protease [Nemania sp. FL0916]
MSLSRFAGMAGTWTMDSTSSVPPAEFSFSVDTTEASVFDPDHRSLADVNDYVDGGKYRSIVKLQIRYERQSPEEPGYAMGTGWLISPDTLVTAGHNVYNWGTIEGGLGRAVHIKCYIGYHGRDSIHSPVVQYRRAKTVITTAEWLTGKDNCHRDIAFIQLDRPFEGNLRVFSYKSTPKFGDEMIGIVGYPADKVHIDKNGREEKGALMYEMFKDIQYNLEDRKSNPLQMLKYRISTFGGQCGGPVIRKNANQVAIATHVYGSGDKNQASVIGKYGNDYDTLLSVFTREYPVVATHEGIDIVNLSSAITSHSSLPMTPTQPLIRTLKPNPSSFHQTEKSFDEGQEEGFLDVFKKVGTYITDRRQKSMPISSPLLGGPTAYAISAITGAVLGAIGNVYADSAVDSRISPLTSADRVAKGTSERAILAEAVLQAVLKMERDHITDKILSYMQTIYNKLAPDAKRIAQRLVPGLLDCVHGLSTDRDYIMKQQRLRRSLSARSLTCNWEEYTYDTNDFLDCMMQPTQPLEGEEEFFERFGTLITTAVRATKPFLREGVKSSFDVLHPTFTETSFDTESTFENPDVQAAELLAKRAIMGEAALQAVMKLSKAEIARLRLVDDSGELHDDEEFLGFVKTTAQKFGPVVKDSALAVIKTILPLIIDSVAKPATNGTAYGSSLSPPTMRPALRQKRSLLSLVNDGTLKAAA